MSKPVIATVSLAGCFGCHMSTLDIDERIFTLAELVNFDRSPINDYKSFQGPVDIGLIEGGVCNSENIHVLKEFRDNCKVLISVGECAIMGGLPALRNSVPVEECLNEAYIDGPTVFHRNKEIIPGDEELPVLLDRVKPAHEIVPIDFYLPGCPPSADLIWQVLTDLLNGREPDISYEMIKYD